MGKDFGFYGYEKDDLEISKSSFFVPRTRLELART